MSDDTDDDNVTNITGLKATPNSAKATLDQIKRTMPELLELIVIAAEIRKVKYDAHIKQGFTPEQALILCKDIS